MNQDFLIVNFNYKKNCFSKSVKLWGFNLFLLCKKKFEIGMKTNYSIITASCCLLKFQIDVQLFLN